MNKPLVIGITGGIGSGKTTIANILRKEGYLVYDSDAEAKRLQIENPVVKQKLIEAFGPEIFDSYGVDRKKLASTVFGNPELLEKLNLIIHPAVMEDFLNWKQLHATERFLFLETAILFESKFNVLTHKVILITASENIRIKRVMKRDGVNEKQVQSRMKNQMSDFEKIKLSDFVINTDDEPLSQKLINNLLSEFRN